MLNAYWCSGKRGIALFGISMLSNCLIDVRHCRYGASHVTNVSWWQRFCNASYYGQIRVKAWHKHLYGTNRTNRWLYMVTGCGSRHRYGYEWAPPKWPKPSEKFKSSDVVPTRRYHQFRGNNPEPVGYNSAVGPPKSSTEGKLKVSITSPSTTQVEKNIQGKGSFLHCINPLFVYRLGVWVQ